MAAIVDLDEEEAYLWAILSDDTGLDLAEFEWIEPESPDGIYRAWDFQYKWYTCRDPYQIDQGARACGKRLALGTLLATPSGWTTMGEVQAGDVLFDDLGNPTTVLAAHPVEADTDAYEVVFSDGSVIVADAEHLWTTRDKRARAADARGTTARSLAVEDRRDRAVAMRAAGRSLAQIAEHLGYADPSGAAVAIRDHGRPTAGARPAARSTAQLRDTLRSGTEANHSVAVAGALDLPDADLPIHPYVLGCWLGNGTSRTGVITSMDEECIDRIMSFGYRSHVVPCTAGDTAKGYRIDYAGSPRGTRGKGLTADLRRLGVLENKHIPPAYLRASIAQRRELLAGLVDTDGHLDARGYGELCFMNEALARGACELLATLGEQPHLAKGDAVLNGIVVGVRYRIHWRPVACPAALARKASRYRPPAAQSSRVTQRRIVDVRPVDPVPMRCITVDSPSRLYLAGEAMIPTHNTVGITMRAFAFPFTFPGQDMLLTAPELNHLRPLTSAIEDRLNGSWLSREMRSKSKGMGIARNPHWECNFLNGSKLVSRLPQRDGRGLKGMHVMQIELDEAQDFPLGGWVEIVETLNRFLPGSSWRAHGVPRGVRDRFYEITMGEDSQWTVHRPMAMNRPSWSQAEREEKIATYGGSRQSPDYKRNIYGEHGDATNPLFVLARLMANVDTDQGSEYNNDVYKTCRVQFEDLRGESPLLKLDIPGSHRAGWALAPSGYSGYYAGMDVGVTSHPSEILVAGQRAGTAKPQLDLLLRVHMQRISMEDQEAVVGYLMEFYGRRLKTFGIDKTGLGFTLWERLARTHGEDRIKGYNFSAKYAVALEDREMKRGETPADLVIERNIVEFASDAMREIVDAKGFLLPFDRELLQEWQGQSYVLVKSTSNPYGKREFSAGKFHTLDAGKMLVAGMRLAALDGVLNARAERTPVLDVFMGA